MFLADLLEDIQAIKKIMSVNKNTNDVLADFERHITFNKVRPLLHQLEVRIKDLHRSLEKSHDLKEQAENSEDNAESGSFAFLDNLFSMFSSLQQGFQTEDKNETEFQQLLALHETLDQLQKILNDRLKSVLFGSRFYYRNVMNSQVNTFCIALATLLAKCYEKYENSKYAVSKHYYQYLIPGLRIELCQIPTASSIRYHKLCEFIIKDDMITPIIISDVLTALSDGQVIPLDNDLLKAINDCDQAKAWLDAINAKDKRQINAARYAYLTAIQSDRLVVNTNKTEESERELARKILAYAQIDTLPQLIDMLLKHVHQNHWNEFITLAVDKSKQFECVGLMLSKTNRSHWQDLVKIVIPDQKDVMKYDELITKYIDKNAWFDFISGAMINDTHRTQLIGMLWQDLPVAEWRQFVKLAVTDLNDHQACFEFITKYVADKYWSDLVQLIQSAHEDRQELIAKFLSIVPKDQWSYFLGLGLRNKNSVTEVKDFILKYVPENNWVEFINKALPQDKKLRYGIVFAILSSVFAKTANCENWKHFLHLTIQDKNKRQKMFGQLLSGLNHTEHPNHNWDVVMAAATANVDNRQEFIHLLSDYATKKIIKRNDWRSIICDEKMMSMERLFSLMLDLKVDVLKDKHPRADEPMLNALIIAKAEEALGVFLKQDVSKYYREPMKLLALAFTLLQVYQRIRMTEPAYKSNFAALGTRFFRANVSMDAKLKKCVELEAIILDDTLDPAAALAAFVNHINESSTYYSMGPINGNDRLSKIVKLIVSLADKVSKKENDASIALVAEQPVATSGLTI